MQKIKKILCATDLSKVSDRLLSWGVELCLGFDASFSVFHAIPPPRGSVTRQIEFERGGEKKEKIEKAREKIKKFMAHFDIKWDLIIAYGDPVLELAKVVKKVEADIVIAASHGLSGLQQFLIGSVVGRMAQTFLQPLLVIPPGKFISDTNLPELQLTNIMIACSLLESDSDLKNYALAFSEKINSKIWLVHVMESPVNEQIVEMTSAPYEDAQRLLEEKLSLRLKNLMPAKTHILQGIPGEELALYAKSHEIDLIIAGVDDRPGRIITTTTAALLRDLPCAVLTVPIKSTIESN
ncbi:MAG: universal stress protein [Desulfobacula sp.]|uniref:universal stress protein n=1 Tax=Desulfobacula sp. TaxID=2593537 RepID=UPI0025B9A5C7|nr:universal stress protein [Desulfobacula sp.]MCD4720188.1 universal stress protein [Desulfobacula sp.]